MRREKGFSLIEIMMAAVVFSLTMLGLVSVFVSGGKQITHVRERIGSAQLGKLFLDPLQDHVSFGDQASFGGWDKTTNALYYNSASPPITTTYCDSLAGHVGQQNPACPSTAERKVNNRVFTAQYDVSQQLEGAARGVRRVVAKITWNE